MKTDIPFKISSISSEEISELKMLCRRSLDNDVIKKRLNSKGKNVDTYVDKLFKGLWLNEVVLANSNQMHESNDTENYYEKVLMTHRKIDRLVAAYKANSLSMITERIVKVLYNLDDPLTLPLITRQLIEYWAWFVYNESVLITLYYKYNKKILEVGLLGKERGKIIINPVCIVDFLGSLSRSPANLATYVKQKIGETLEYDMQKNNIGSFQKELAKQAKVFAEYLASFLENCDLPRIDNLVEEYRLCCSLTHPTSVGLMFSSPGSVKERLVLSSTYLLSSLDAINNVSRNMFLLLNYTVHPDGFKRLVYNFAFLNNSLNKYPVRMKDYEEDYSYEVMKKIFESKGCRIPV